MKASTSPIETAAQAPWALIANAGQQQAAASTECATAMFRGFEAMRKVQEQAAHTAAARHAVVAEKLKGSCGPGDLMALQAELFQFDVESATRYWQQLGAAALEMQTRMLGCVGTMVDSKAPHSGTRH